MGPGGSSVSLSRNDNAKDVEVAYLHADRISRRSSRYAARRRSKVRTVYLLDNTFGNFLAGADMLDFPFLSGASQAGFCIFGNWLLQQVLYSFFDELGPFITKFLPL